MNLITFPISYPVISRGMLFVGRSGQVLSGGGSDPFGGVKAQVRTSKSILEAILAVTPFIPSDGSGGFMAI